MQRQEMSMCCLSTTKIFYYYCLVQCITAITHCRGAEQQQQQEQYLGQTFEHQQLLTGTETLEHCSIRNSGLVSKLVSGTIVDIRVWVSSIFNIFFDVHCPYQAMSSMSIVHINYCQYQPFPISKLINIKVDHPVLSNKHNSAATNVSDVEQGEYWNKAPYVLFFSSNQEEFILFYIPKFYKGFPSISVESRQAFFPQVVALVTMFTEKVMKHSMLAKNEVSKLSNNKQMCQTSILPNSNEIC